MAQHEVHDRSLKKVVVVDDDRDLAEVLTMLLQAEGFDAAHATSGAVGLALIRKTNAHAVILDYMLGDMSGSEVGHALRIAPESSSIKILMYTSTPEEVVRTAFDGYDSFLSKPVLHGHLISALDRILRIDPPVRHSS